MASLGKILGFFALRIRLWELVAAGGAVLSTASVAGFWGQYWWFFDIFSPFRVQYAVALCLASGILLLARRFRFAGLCAVFAIVNGVIVAPMFLGKAPVPAIGTQHYRGMLINVNTQTGQPMKVAQAIEQFSPDFVVLEEINEQWLTSLSGTLGAYAYSNAVPRDDNFGIGLFSKHPLLSSQVRQFGETQIPWIVAEVQLTEGPVTLIAVHPLPPAGAENTQLRNEQLAELPDLVRRAHSPVLLVGDLNATPWCYAFKQLVEQSGLLDGAKGRGFLPTWPTFMPLALIPIDHCLHSKPIQITQMALGPKTGSDHFPLVFDFVVNSSPPAK